MTKNIRQNKGGSRIDSSSTHGWFVRGYKNGRTFSKLFSDLKIGGKRKALLLACQYRDQLLKELDKMPVRASKRRVS